MRNVIIKYILLLTALHSYLMEWAFNPPPFAYAPDLILKQTSGKMRNVSIMDNGQETLVPYY